jgi:RES domain
MASLSPSSGLDVAALSRIPARPFSAIVLRNTYLPDPGKGAPDPFYGTGISGRFGTHDGTIYTTNSPEVMWAEYCRNNAKDVELANPYASPIRATDIAGMPTTEVPAPLPARTIVQLDVTLDRVVDLTTGATQRMLFLAGFDPLHLTADGYGDCQRLAAAAVALGWEALRVPSAAWRVSPGWCLPIFKKTTDYVLIPWGVVAHSARPTVDVAHLTTYKTGQRPTWLPAPPTP